MPKGGKPYVSAKKKQAASVKKSNAYAIGKGVMSGKGPIGRTLKKVFK